MNQDDDKIIRVSFYKTEGGNRPVRDWLMGLSKADRKAIGNDIKDAENGWPLGMPLIKKLERSLWEVRTDLASNRQSRVIFTVEDGQMVLLHAFFKSTQKTPKGELDTARARLARLNSS